MNCVASNEPIIYVSMLLWYLSIC